MPRHQQSPQPCCQSTGVGEALWLNLELSFQGGVGDAQTALELGVFSRPGEEEEFKRKVGRVLGLPGW